MPLMKFKDEAAEQTWQDILYDAHQHDSFVWEAICFAAAWVFEMESGLEDLSALTPEEFGDRAETCLHKAGTPITYKQLVWVITWVKQCWKWGDRIVSTRLF